MKRIQRIHILIGYHVIVIAFALPAMAQSKLWYEPPTARERERQELDKAFRAWTAGLQKPLESRICRDDPEEVYAAIDREQTIAEAFFTKRFRDVGARESYFVPCSAETAPGAAWNVTKEREEIRKRLRELTERQRALRTAPAPGASAGIRAAVQEKQDEEARAIGDLILILVERDQDLESAEGSTADDKNARQRFTAACGEALQSARKEKDLVTGSEGLWRDYYEELRQRQDACPAPGANPLSSSASDSGPYPSWADVIGKPEISVQPNQRARPALTLKPSSRKEENSK